MKKIRLFKLKLRNFKGVEQREIDFNGYDKAVCGTNETGKTTLADAYRWLLFDKSSSGDSQFGIKPLDKNNNEIHHLNSIVEGKFQIVGKEVKEFTLKKDYHEKWTKKRGTNEQEFSGHTTDYYIDEEPMKKSEYEDFIAENFMSEDIFKLITDPLYFNEQLHWKDQREIIFDLVEQPEPGIVATQAETFYLAEKLEGKTPEQYTKILKNKMKKINKELDKIPERIDEQQRNLSTEGLDYDSNLSDLKAQLSDLKDKQKKLQEKKAELKANSKNESIEKLMKLKQEKSALKNKLSNQANELLNDIKTKLGNVSREIRDKESDIKQFEKTIKQNEEKREKLLEKQEEWQSKEFDPDAEVCSQCGQELPEDTKDEHRKKFNKKKAEKLEELSNETENITTAVKKGTQEIEKLEEEIKEMKKKQSKLAARKEKGERYIKQVKNDKLEELAELTEKIEEQEIIAEDDKPDEDKIKQVSEDLKEVSDEIDRVSKAVANMENIEKAKARIQELQEKEEKLVNKYEKYDKELYDLEKYKHKQVEMMEKDINDRFEYTHFKMFEEQINGGLKETCEATKNGVPYSDLNTGSKYQVGMDIISTLTEYYGVQAPIFIDNRERIAHLPDIESQTINLIMVPGRKELELLNLSETSADEIVEKQGGIQEALF